MLGVVTEDTRAAAASLLHADLGSVPADVYDRARLAPRSAGRRCR